MGHLVQPDDRAAAQRRAHARQRGDRTAAMAGVGHRLLVVGSAASRWAGRRVLFRARAGRAGRHAVRPERLATDPDRFYGAEPATTPAHVLALAISYAEGPVGKRVCRRME